MAIHLNKSTAFLSSLTPIMTYLVNSLLCFLLPLSIAQASCIGLGCQCEVSATAVNFGVYNPLGGDVDTTGTVSITCGALIVGALVSYNISLSTGNSGNYLLRQLSNGSMNLNYNLYTNLSHTTAWGNGTGSTSIISDGYTLNLFSEVRNYTVYGRIPGSQNVSAGTYTDSIVATVIF